MSYDPMAFFNSAKKIEKIKLYGGARNEKREQEISQTTTSSSNTQPLKNIATGTDYAEEYVRKEEEQLLRASKSHENRHKSMPQTLNRKTERIYESYNFSHRPKTNLSIETVRAKIIETVNCAPVTIVQGATGCGKSTQVPQFILDHCFEMKKPCNIIVTQPRRIAAISIAKRVCSERKWPLGSLVGYQVGLSSQLSPDTRLTFCTTGVLLQRLIGLKQMNDYTHIILDEVHERDQDMDFLLLVVRKLLRSNSHRVKVILMSATIQADKFAKYFSSYSAEQLTPAPIINVQKSNFYKFTPFYLCELAALGPPPPPQYERPEISYEMMQFCAQLIAVMDKLDENSHRQRPTVLIFLPGIHEIEEMHNILSSHMYQTLKWDIVVLHSSITSEEQQRIFNPLAKGYRRVILSTNIAESSITVPDVKYVIDFCLTKQLTTDPTTNYQCLTLTWASQANCAQRAGRTGRVMDGRVYRLIPKALYNELPSENPPEITRAPLEIVVLRAKMLDLDNPKATLALALDPPDLHNLKATVLQLKEAGGLNDADDEFDGQLTDLGRIMSQLPVDIHISKMIVLGHVFSVTREAIIIAASMAVKSMFSAPFRRKFESYKSKLQWARNDNSDCHAYLHAYRAWRREKSRRHNRQSERHWAQKNCLEIRVLHEIDALVKDLTVRLERLGIKETEMETDIWDDDEWNLVVKIVYAGAFYPQYFLARPKHSEIARSSMFGDLDLLRTVYLQGWSHDRPGAPYVRHFEEQFSDCLSTKADRINVTFDDSTNVYLEFQQKSSSGHSRHHDRSGDIPIAVYQALKSRTNNVRSVVIPVMEATTNYPADCVEPAAISDCTTSITLRGPFSPLEVELSSIINAGWNRQVIIAESSVNSMLLDSTLVNPRERLLVAGSIGQNSTGRKLIIRNSVLMPAIPGLPSLLCLIFAPQIELRLDDAMTKYVGALCGLGYNRQNRHSLFPDHDLMINFNVEITSEDLKIINDLRYWMSTGIFMTTKKRNDMTSCQRKVKETLLRIVDKQRKFMTDAPDLDRLRLYSGNWCHYKSDLFLAPDDVGPVAEMIYQVFKPHQELQLNT